MGGINNLAWEPATAGRLRNRALELCSTARRKAIALSTALAARNSTHRAVNAARSHHWQNRQAVASRVNSFNISEKLH
jgi:hypothetical protein